MTCVARAGICLRGFTGFTETPRETRPCLTWLLSYAEIFTESRRRGTERPTPKTPREVGQGGGGGGGWCYRDLSSPCDDDDDDDVGRTRRSRDGIDCLSIFTSPSPIHKTLRERRGQLVKRVRAGRCQRRERLCANKLPRARAREQFAQ